VEVSTVIQSHKVPAGSLERKPLEAICNWQGIMYQKFIPESATVNKEKYKRVLIRLRHNLTEASRIRGSQRLGAPT
jgi:hypothetical protein